MNALLLTVLGIAELSVLGIAFLLQPDDAGSVYWLSTLWICILIAGNWYTSATIFSEAASDEKRSETGSLIGSLPGISILLPIYSFFSIGLLLSSSALGIVSWRLQFAIQLGALGLIASICIIMLIAAKGAQQGSFSHVSKREILDQIRRIQRTSSVENVTSLANEANSYVNSKMPHPSKLSEDQLIQVLSALKNCDPNDSEQVESVFKSVRSL
ncbi:hypothetical protein N9M22_06480 [Litoricolaceae bacterium]|nr:hypothetical protein [Litorivicinaceae bacterium]